MDQGIDIEDGQAVCTETLPGVVVTGGGRIQLPLALALPRQSLKPGQKYIVDADIVNKSIHYASRRFNEQIHNTKSVYAAAFWNGYGAALARISDEAKPFVDREDERCLLDAPIGYDHAGRSTDGAGDA